MDISTISKSDFKKICRICLQMKDNLSLEHNADLFNKLHYTIGLKLEQDDNLPKLFCTNCTENINSMFNFKKLCLHSQQILLDVIKNNSIKETYVNMVNIKNEFLNYFNNESDNEICHKNIEHIIVSSDCIKNDIAKEENVDDLSVNIDEVIQNNEDDPLDNTANKSLSLMITNLVRRNVEKIEGTNHYRCTLCGKVCNVRYQFRKHMLLHTPKEVRLKHCKICGKGYTRKDTYAKHLKDHENENFQVKEKCKFCGKSYANLKTHIQVVHSDDKPYECAKCNAKFAIKYYLKKHYRSIHEGIKPEKLLLCPQCGKTFSSLRDLRSHSAFHSGIKLYKCTICNREFTFQQNLTEHVKIYHNPTRLKKFSCTMCKKKFMTNTILKSHLRTHTGERPFSCKICQKSFPYKCSLYTHMKIHNLEGKISIT